MAPQPQRKPLPPQAPPRTHVPPPANDNRRRARVLGAALVAIALAAVAILLVRFLA